MPDSSNIGVAEPGAQVQRAPGSVRMEGLEPTADAKRIFERYASGESRLMKWVPRFAHRMPDNSDPHLYPTNVLRNLRRIRDAAVLAEFEANATAACSIELNAALEISDLAR